ncbi:sortase family protein [Streptococcus ictaluri 707-05]|uniref:Sortase family protein n=1 Tax=Streptococcus ictaluri 707-05 TaxID=764299 RepID=G5K4P0_9STRE|nr:sortase family protein [Streptococcus ictaluri 707-05]
MLTCTPYMINSHRLLVRGKRIPYKEKVEEGDKKAGQVHQLKRYASIGLVLIFLRVLVWYRKKKKKRGRK